MSEQRDKNLWIFNAGNSFAGNPKWMFEYIIRHHKENQTGLDVLQCRHDELRA